MVHQYFHHLDKGELMSMIATMSVLVTGANGKTGRRVTAQLQQRQVNVRAGSRKGTPAFDWAKSHTWPAALEGISTVYLNFYPDLAVPEAPKLIGDFCTLAAKLGVNHIILLSGRGEVEARVCEEIVKGAGLAWTIVRASWFNQNFSEGFLLGSVLQGNIALPVGQVREPFVDVEDIADVVVAAVTDPIHRGRLYELTGPELLSFEDVSRILSDVLKKTVDFTAISDEQFIAGLTKQQLPDEVLLLLRYLFTTVLDGRNQYICHGVEQALGRPPRSFYDYATTTAKRGIWRAEESA